MEPANRKTSKRKIQAIEPNSPSEQPKTENTPRTNVLRGKRGRRIVTVRFKDPPVTKTCQNIPKTYPNIHEEEFRNDPEQKIDRGSQKPHQRVQEQGPLQNPDLNTASEKNWPDSGQVNDENIPKKPHVGDTEQFPSASCAKSELHLESRPNVEQEVTMEQTPKRRRVGRPRKIKQISTDKSGPLENQKDEEKSLDTSVDADPIGTPGCSQIGQFEESEQKVNQEGDGNEEEPQVPKRRRVGRPRKIRDPQDDYIDSYCKTNLGAPKSRASTIIIWPDNQKTSISNLKGIAQAQVGLFAAAFTKTKSNSDRNAPADRKNAKLEEKLGAETPRSSEDSQSSNNEPQNLENQASSSKEDPTKEVTKIGTSQVTDIKSLNAKGSLEVHSLGQKSCVGTTQKFTEPMCTFPSPLGSTKLPEEAHNYPQGTQLREVPTTEVELERRSTFGTVGVSKDTKEDNKTSPQCLEKMGAHLGVKTNEKVTVETQTCGKIIKSFLGDNQSDSCFKKSTSKFVEDTENIPQSINTELEQRQNSTESDIVGNTLKGGLQGTNTCVEVGKINQNDTDFISVPGTSKMDQSFGVKVSCLEVDKGKISESFEDFIPENVQNTPKSRKIGRNLFKNSLDENNITPNFAEDDAFISNSGQVDSDSSNTSAPIITDVQQSIDQNTDQETDLQNLGSDSNEPDGKKRRKSSSSSDSETPTPKRRIVARRKDKSVPKPRKIPPQKQKLITTHRKLKTDELNQIQITMSTTETDGVPTKDFKSYLESSKMTYRVIKRANFVIQTVRQEKVIVDLSKLMRAIKDEENSEGYTVSIDKKSIMRLILKLSKDGYIKFRKATLKTDLKEKTICFICDPSIEDTHSVIQSALEQYTYKFFIGFKSSQEVCIEEKDLPTNSEEVEELKYDEKGLSEEDTMINYTYSRNAGKNYGYTPKFVRTRLIHEYMFYLAYEVFSEPITDRVEIEKVLQAHSKDTTDCIFPIYQRDLNWKTFVPPLPTHQGWQKGWTLLSDVLLRLPLILFVKCFNTPYVIPGIEYYLDHPIRKLVCVKSLPPKIRNGLLIGRRYIFSMHETCLRLCHMGLIQFGPQRLKEKDQVFVYVNKKTTLLNTVTSTAGYHQISDQEYDKLYYTFNSTQDLEKYWFDLWTICVNTHLGTRNAVTGQIIVLEQAQTKPQLVEACKPRTADEAVELDIGQLPGDQKGAAGLDSALFAHLKRNWNWSELFTQRTQKAKADNSKKPFLEPRRHMDHEIKVLKPQKVKFKSKRQAQQKTIIRQVMPKRKSRIRKPVYDAKDKECLKNMSKLRTDWTEIEDNVLLLCLIASQYLCPNRRRQTVEHTTIRDVLHRMVSYAANKTSRSCQRRINYIMKNPKTRRSVHMNLEEIKQCEYVRNKFGEVVKKHSGHLIPIGTLNIAFVELVGFLNQNYATKKKGSNKISLPDNLRDVGLYFTRRSNPKVAPTTFKDVENLHDINFDVIRSVIHSSLCCQKDKTSFAFQLFKIYQQYPESLLRSVISKIRLDQMVSVKKVLKSKSAGVLPFSSPFQLSISYINQLQNSKFAYQVFTEANSFLKDVIEFLNNWDSDQENDNLEITIFDNGTAFLIADFMEKFNLGFKFEHPEQVIALHPQITNDSSYERIVQRYNEILSDTNFNPNLWDRGSDSDLSDLEEQPVSTIKTSAIRRSSRVAFYMMRAEMIEEIDKNSAQHIYDYFVVNASKVFLEIPTENNQLEAETGSNESGEFGKDVSNEKKDSEYSVEKAGQALEVTEKDAEGKSIESEARNDEASVKNAGNSEEVSQDGVGVFGGFGRMQNVIERDAEGQRIDSGSKNEGLKKTADNLKASNIVEGFGDFKIGATIDEPVGCLEKNVEGLEIGAKPQMKSQDRKGVRKFEFGAGNKGTSEFVIEEAQKGSKDSRDVELLKIGTIGEVAPHDGREVAMRFEFGTQIEDMSKIYAKKIVEEPQKTTESSGLFDFRAKVKSSSEKSTEELEDSQKLRQKDNTASERLLRTPESSSTNKNQEKQVENNIDRGHTGQINTKTRCISQSVVEKVDQKVISAAGAIQLSLDNSSETLNRKKQSEKMGTNKNTTETNISSAENSQNVCQKDVAESKDLPLSQRSSSTSPNLENQPLSTNANIKTQANTVSGEVNPNLDQSKAPTTSVNLPLIQSQFPTDLKPPIKFEISLKQLQHKYQVHKVLENIKSHIIPESCGKITSQYVLKIHPNVQKSDFEYIEKIKCYVHSKKDLGATLEDLKCVQPDTKDVQLNLEQILDLLLGLKIILRVGTSCWRFVHFDYKTNWVVSATKVQKEHKEKYKDFGSRWKGKNVIKLSNNSGDPENIKLLIAPWIRLDGTINRRVLDRWLGSILSKILENPGISLHELCFRFDFLKPVEVIALCQHLKTMECISFIKTVKPKVTLFSQDVNIQIVESSLFDEPKIVLIEPSHDAVYKIAIFLGQKNYATNFMD